MDKKQKIDYAKLLETNKEHLKKLHLIVQDSLEDDKLIAEKLQDNTSAMTFGERIADKVAVFGGSWRFIIIFMCILFGWIILNTFILIQKPFDPYPYILLNLLLSCIAALQAPVIMMSQNRQEQKDRQRSLNDYAINLKSEIELQHLHQKMDLLMVEQMQMMLDLQAKQMRILEGLEKRTS